LRADRCRFARLNRRLLIWFTPPETAEKVRIVDPNVKEAEQELQRALGVRVTISDRNGKGKILIEYSSLEDFDRILEVMKGK